MNTTTFVQKKAEIKRDWHLIDAKGMVLGQLGTQAATFLIGKHKPTYTPNIECGDFVVVINCTQVVVTGKKMTDKLYTSHSGIPGGFKRLPYNEVMAEHPERIIQSAVKGMLPKNKLQTPRMNRLKIFTTAEHPYADKFGGSKE